MASEAQRLIGISLTKIAQSRSNRGGVSLHKNLLVATVLQKARYIFMEEAYNMVHYQQQQQAAAAMMAHQQQQLQQQQQERIQQDHPQDTDNLIGLTVEEAGIDSMNLPEEEPSSTNLQDYLQPSCLRCQESRDKENQPPVIGGANELTYLDLDTKGSSCVQQQQQKTFNSSSCQKRKRSLSEWETEEAVQSIIPKKKCCQDASTTNDSNEVESFLEDTLLFGISKMLEHQQETPSSCSSPAQCAASENFTSTTAVQQQDSNKPMEVERITSLVSIFSFGAAAGVDASNKLNRSVSTPDLCSSQAKDAGTGDSLQRRFLAMTV